MDAAVSNLPADVDKALQEKARAWLALSLTPGLGPTRVRRLVEYFGGAAAVLRASLTELESTGILASSAQSLGTGKSAELAQEELARAAGIGVRVVTLDDSDYPNELKQIYDPPPVLYVRGEVSTISQPGIAVVGTRHPTPYGTGMAERLACDLAARGLTIISGMARGVDTAGHRGAIAGKGKTVAVFGTGIDVIYPKENTRLSEQILALSGALISEFPIGTFPAPQNFPIRNRIISGMSVGVLVSKQPSTAALVLRPAAPWNRIVMSLQCPATSPTRIPGGRTRSSSRVPSWLRRGRMFGKNCRHRCGLP